MDTSKKYILMCEAAQEIQEIFDNAGCLNNVKFGNFYYHTQDDMFYCAGSDFDVNDEDNPLYAVGSYSAVWLPRQDQLQEMVKKEGKTWDFLRYFYKKTEGIITQYYLQFDSFEQLWLAFVMENKYNKMWNNKVQKWEEL